MSHVQYDISRRTVNDSVDENRPTSAMFPRGSDNYCSSDCKLGPPIEYSIDGKCATMETVLEYKMPFSDTTRVEVRRGLSGKGLFVLEDVDKGSIVIEYKGNRVTGEDLRRLNESFDRHNIHPDIQAAVPSENAVIDPGMVGNEAQYVNHHCKPNS